MQPWESKGGHTGFPRTPDKFWVRFLSPHALHKENAGKTEIVTRKNSGQRIFMEWAAKRSGNRDLTARSRSGPRMLARETSRIIVRGDSCRTIGSARVSCFKRTPQDRRGVCAERETSVS